MLFNLILIPNLVSSKIIFENFVTHGFQFVTITLDKWRSGFALLGDRVRLRNLILWVMGIISLHIGFSIVAQDPIAGFIISILLGHEP